MASERYTNYLNRILNDPETKDLCEEYKTLTGRYPGIYMDFLDGYEGTLADLIRSDIEYRKQHQHGLIKASNE